MTDFGSTGPRAFTLTPGQEGVLADSLASRGAYVQQVTCLLDGHFAPSAFAEAWQLALDRHAALRVTFSRRDSGEPIQLVHPAANVPFEVDDWRGLSPAEQDDAWARLLEDDRGSGFRLAVAPLMRVRLRRLGEHRHRMLWSVHHILVDGWSAALVLADVFEAHAALRDGERPALAPAGDFAGYLDWLAAQDANEVAEAWKAKGDDLRDSRRLARDGSGPSGRAPLRVARSVQGPDVGALDAVARTHTVPVNAFVQAAWAIAVSRFTSSPSAVFGLTVAHRPVSIPNISSTVGMLVNTLPVTAPVEGRIFLDLVHDMHHAGASLQRQAHVSPAEMRRWCDLPADLPVFDTILSFEDYPGWGSWWRRDPQLSIADVAVHGQTTATCTALVARSGDEIELGLLVDPALVHEATATSLLEDWRGFLIASCRRPGSKVADLTHAVKARGSRFQAALNRTQRDLPEPATISAALDRVAASSSDAVAIEHDAESIDYAELQRRSLVVAEALAAQGLGAGDPVPLATGSSMDAIVAMIGIVRLGAFYVPLDVHAPPARNAQLVERLGARLAIVDTPAATPRGVEGVSLDELTRLHRAGSKPPPTGPSPESTAYAIFTSGSTGQPKGVLTPNRAVVRLALTQDYVAVGPGTRVAQLSTLAFDAATFEIFGTLLNGGTVVVLGAGTLMDPTQLCPALAAHDVDVAFLTTAVFNSVVDIDPEALASCRTILFGGENADPARVRAAREASMVELVHVYGPTEATTFATAHRVDDVPAGAVTVPIGTPIANTTTWILDRELNPLPSGAVGELCVGGPGVGAYLDDEEPSPFVPDPFAGGPSHRLYRTGDLARWTGEGTIEFVGRRDDQVKLRGFRVELGEIEAALRALPGVREAVVLVVGDDLQRRLTAFAVTDDDNAQLGGDRLVARLRETLPRYMVPSAVHLVREWPLTVSGKIDRRRLARTVGLGPARSRAAMLGVGGGRATLSTVLACFEHVLEHPVGADERFFDAGGHSLLAVRLVGKLRARCDVTVDVVDVFAHPTPRALAAELGTRARITGAAGAKPQ